VREADKVEVEGVAADEEVPEVVWVVAD